MKFSMTIEIKNIRNLSGFRRAPANSSRDLDDGPRRLFRLSLELVLLKNNQVILLRLIQRSNCKESIIAKGELGAPSTE